MGLGTMGYNFEDMGHNFEDEILVSDQLAFTEEEREVMQEFGLSIDSLDSLNDDELAQAVLDVRNFLLEKNVVRPFKALWSSISDADKILLYKSGAPTSGLANSFMPMFANRYNSMLLNFGFLPMLSVGNSFAPCVRSMVMLGLLELPAGTDIDLLRDSQSDVDNANRVLGLVKYIPGAASLKPYLSVLGKLNEKAGQVRAEAIQLDRRASS